MKENNTIAGLHIRSYKDGIIKCNTKKQYQWHIPKQLRHNLIQPGDIVSVRTDDGKARVLVMDVFREELEETQRQYKCVAKVLERAPQPENI